MGLLMSENANQIHERLAMEAHTWKLTSLVADAGGCHKLETSLNYIVNSKSTCDNRVRPCIKEPKLTGDSASLPLGWLESK